MLIAPVPLVVALIGLVLFCVASPNNGKLARIGEHMMWTGLLVTLMSTMGKTAHLF